MALEAGLRSVACSRARLVVWSTVPPSPELIDSVCCYCNFKSTFAYSNSVSGVVSGFQSGRVLPQIDILNPV